ncbi:hypothetical protein E2C01_048811 [Portunus trituberculatus]|uniref:Uncharacterized protein n=1 Tax=Portunus trituberculatus TaxID=210409 RepID=A0A5B7G7E7_PORTR|nr:hypothetical protein [Portunus trituberculatus]
MIRLLLTLGRVFGNQKINAPSFYYFNPPHEFLKLCKNHQIVGRTNMETRPGTEGVKATHFVKTIL